MASVRFLFGGIFAQAPCWRTRSLIQSASYPRSASSIDPDLRRDKSLAASRLSCASPVVSASRIGKPLLSTNACILLVSPPRDRPMDCLLLRATGPVLVFANDGSVG